MVKGIVADHGRSFPAYKGPGPVMHAPCLTAGNAAKVPAGHAALGAARQPVPDGRAKNVRRFCTTVYRPLLVQAQDAPVKEPSPTGRAVVVTCGFGARKKVWQETCVDTFTGITCRVLGVVAADAVNLRSEEVILGKDFLRTAQRLVNLKIRVKHNPIITAFSEKFTNFGSCFAQNLEHFLHDYGFDCYFDRYICAHYSTETLANTLNDLVTGRPITSDDLYFYKDKKGGLLPYQFLFRNRVFGDDPEAYALSMLEKIQQNLLKHIRETKFFLITIGTSRIVRLNRNGKTINSALEIPKSEYQTHMLSVEENVVHLESIMRSLRALKQSDDFHAIFTISPQRYRWPSDLFTGDCPFVDNNLSKSLLHVSLHEFLKTQDASRMHYFPSFEIVIDELRNYETLSGYDFLHINQEYTPRYVVKRFLKTYLDTPLREQLPILDDCGVLLFRIAGDMRHNGSYDNPEYLDQVVKLIDRARDAAAGADWNPFLLGRLYGLVAKMGRTDLLPEFTAWLEGHIRREGYAQFMLWGCSGFYRMYYGDWIRNRADDGTFLGFIDNDPAKAGTMVDGYPVFSPEQAMDKQPDLIVIASGFHDEIHGQLDRLHYRGKARHFH